MLTFLKIYCIHIFSHFSRAKFKFPDPTIHFDQIPYPFKALNAKIKFLPFPGCPYQVGPLRPLDPVLVPLSVLPRKCPSRPLCLTDKGLLVVPKLTGNTYMDRAYSMVLISSGITSLLLFFCVNSPVRIPCRGIPHTCQAIT